MTKEITKAIILQEMQDKFKLRELAPEIFSFSEMVIPTYDIEQHLQMWETIHKTVSITSATTFLFFTVPYNERWTLRSYMNIFYNEGAYQMSGAYIVNRPDISSYIYLDLKKNQATSYLVNLPVPVVINPGNQIRVMIDTYVSTANLEVFMDVRKEEIR